MTTLATPRSQRTRDPSVCHAPFDDQRHLFATDLKIQGTPLRADGRPGQRHPSSHDGPNWEEAKTARP